MMVWIGVLVGLAVLIVALVSLFRTLISMGVSIAVILVLIAAALYFFPEFFGGYRDELEAVWQVLWEGFSWVRDLI